MGMSEGQPDTRPSPKLAVPARISPINRACPLRTPISEQYVRVASTVGNSGAEHRNGNVGARSKVAMLDPLIIRQSHGLACGKLEPKIATNTAPTKPGGRDVNDEP
jgi:hypothetical protein